MASNNKLLVTIILCAFAARMFYLFFFADLKNDNYFEYGYIAENVINGKGFSLFYFENDSLRQVYNDRILPYPSAFMPPLYVFNVLPVFYLDDPVHRNLILLSSQIILSLFVIYFMFRLTDLLFGKNAAVTASLILLLIPEYTFITTVHNSVVIYHLLIMMMLYYALTEDLRNSFKGILIFSALSGFLVYTRSEYFLFYVIVLLYLFFKKEYKQVAISVTVIIIILSPWIIRNAIVFEKLIPFTTSSGLNLYRGNNPVGIGNWGDKGFIDDIRKISDGNNFEIIYNDYYKAKAISFIKDNPGIFVKNFFIKIFNLWAFDNEDKRSMNLFYLIPSMLVIITSISGIIICRNESKFVLFYLLLAATTISSAVFFTLPRHQIMMKIILIPFCAFYVNHIISILRKSEKKII